MGWSAASATTPTSRSNGSQVETSTEKLSAEEITGIHSDDRGLTVLEILTPPVNTMLYNADCRYFALGLADFVPFSFSSAPLMCEKSGDC